MVHPLQLLRFLDEEVINNIAARKKRKDGEWLRGVGDCSLLLLVRLDDHCVCSSVQGRWLAGPEINN